MLKVDSGLHRNWRITFKVQPTMSTEEVYDSREQINNCIETKDFKISNEIPYAVEKRSPEANFGAKCFKAAHDHIKKTHAEPEKAEIYTTPRTWTIYGEPSGDVLGNFDRRKQLWCWNAAVCTQLGVQAEDCDISAEVKSMQ